MHHTSVDKPIAGLDYSVEGRSVAKQLRVESCQARPKIVTMKTVAKGFLLLSLLLLFLLNNALGWNGGEIEDHPKYRRVLKEDLVQGKETHTSFGRPN